MADTGPPTILFDLFMTNQRRKRLIEAALAGVDELPPEDYPFYVLIGAEGPGRRPGSPAGWTCRSRPCSSASAGLESRGHAERVRNPEDGRSILIRLTPDAGQRLLADARPQFRAYAEAVEARLGPEPAVAAAPRGPRGARATSLDAQG